MCLVRVRAEEDVVVPYRVAERHRRHSPVSIHRASHTSVRRYSRDDIARESSPRRPVSYVPAPSSLPVPAPKPLAIPAPQPVPVFVEQQQPPPPAPVSIASPAKSQHLRHHGAHYVEVSPRSSATSQTSSHGRSDYVYREREIRRERAYSPESPRYEHFRYVEPARSESDFYERDRYDRGSRSRQRSRSRGGDYYETSARISYSNDDRRRRREYGD